ncbi:MAG TPA: hypothetical protein VF796_22820, partial [Humisphaera sp.]
DADAENLAANASFADANFGADAFLRVSRDSDDQFVAYLTFDISSVTSVGSASLQLFGGQQDLLDGTNFVSVFSVPDPTWVEGNGTHPPDQSGAGLNLDDNPAGELRWNNRPAQGSGDLDTVGVGIDQVYSWDVTSYLQARKAAGATLVSLKLLATSGAGTAVFSSREGVSPPVLNIDDDAIPPTAAPASSNVTTSGGTTQTVTVTYADDAGIDPSTINTSDLTVTGPGGPLTTTGVSVNSANPKSVVATYTLTPPGGAWDGGDNGTYSIAVNVGEVTDFAGNAATGSGSFAVNIPVDTTPPAASAFNAQAITSAGGSTYTFTVTYTDNVAINGSTIGTDDLTVTKTGGGPTLAVTNVTKSGSGGTVNATYTVSAPNGSWTAADNGTYTIAVAAGAVADANGNVSAAASRTFQVAIPDTGAPTVVISPIATVTTAGVTTTQITVTYTDNQQVAASSIDAGDLTVVRDGGSALAVTLLSRSPDADAASIVATYSVTAPGGFWNADDGGTYTVTVLPAAVRDTSNNATALASSSFDVDIPSNTAVTDPLFNGGEPVSTGFVAEATATDALGRILVAGRQGDRAAGTSQAVLQRLNPDGTLDTFWGEGGQIIADVQSNDGFCAVAVDEKQRVVCAGFRGGELEIIRYDAKGRLDRKFGQRGVVLADWGGTDDTARAVVALPGGAILVAGTSGGSFALARFDSKGNTDTTFGTNGARLIKPGSDACAVGALAVLPDGSIAAAGTQGTTVSLLRLDPAGAPVAGFGTDGVLTVLGLGVRTDLGAQDHTVGLAVSRDGKLLVGSRTTGGDFGVRRYNADGSPDTTFGGGDGLDSVDLGGDDDVDFVGLQGSGQIVLAGTTDAGVPGGGTRKLAVAVLRADGGVDPSFSAGGKFTDDADVVADPGTSGPFVLHAGGAMQVDGKLLVSLADAAARPTSSPLRRVIAPGSGLLGRFGTVNGRSVKLAFTDADGSKVSLSLKGGGVGEALWDGNVLDLVLTGTGAKSSLGVSAKGGNKRVVLGDLRTDGGLKAFGGKSADLVGTFYVNGDAGKISVGTLTGTLAALGTIASLSVAGNVAGSFVLAGVSLGTDAKIGGTGGAADGYGTGRIAKLSVGGAMSATFVGSGVDPVDGTYGNAGDIAPGTPASEIGSVSIKKGLDAGSTFEAGAFVGSIKVPAKVVPGEDARFKVLTA